MQDPNERIKQLEKERAKIDKEWSDGVEEDGMSKGLDAWRDKAHYEIDLEIKILRGEWT